LANAHKRQFELEKQNTLLSVQLQSLKFDIDYLNGVIGTIKHNGATNKAKNRKDIINNNTAMAKSLSKDNF